MGGKWTDGTSVEPWSALKGLRPCSLPHTAHDFCPLETRTALKSFSDLTQSTVSVAESHGGQQSGLRLLRSPRSLAAMDTSCQSLLLANISGGGNASFPPCFATGRSGDLWQASSCWGGPRQGPTSLAPRGHFHTWWTSQLAELLPVWHHCPVPSSVFEPKPVPQVHFRNLKTQLTSKE